MKQRLPVNHNVVEVNDHTWDGCKNGSHDFQSHDIYLEVGRVYYTILVRRKVAAQGSVSLCAMPAEQPTPSGKPFLPILTATGCLVP